MGLLTVAEGAVLEVVSLLADDSDAGFQRPYDIFSMSSRILDLTRTTDSFMNCSKGMLVGMDFEEREGLRRGGAAARLARL